MKTHTAVRLAARWMTRLLGLPACSRPVPACSRAPCRRRCRRRAARCDAQCARRRTERRGLCRCGSPRCGRARTTPRSTGECTRWADWCSAAEEEEEEGAESRASRPARSSLARCSAWGGRCERTRRLPPAAGARRQSVQSVAQSARACADVQSTVRLTRVRPVP